MPAKNIVKTFCEDSFYHLYNRGIEKQKIFRGEQDYQVLLNILKKYLMEPTNDAPDIIRPDRQTKLYEKIKLVAYCLMPNHFHLLVKQKTHNAITKFMRRLGNAYIRYFNEKYERVDSLFQGNYKAVMIASEDQLLHLSRYIHLNPTKLQPSPDSIWQSWKEYPYSSYKDYLKQRNTIWIHPNEVTQYFRSSKRLNMKDILSYQSFVEDYQKDSEDILGELTLETESHKMDPQHFL